MQTLAKKSPLGEVFSQHFNSKWLRSLLNKPSSQLCGNYNGHDYIATIIVPNYAALITEHYKEYIAGSLHSFCQFSEIAVCPTHFGVEIRFSDPAELMLHDEKLFLDNGLRQLIGDVGAVVIKNAYMVDKFRAIGHRNRFPHLNFHIDRSSNHPTHYSMYARDPFDVEQKFPRTSSTLFIPSIVGHLQGIKEGSVDPVKVKGVRGTYNLFTKEPVNDYMGNLILEHRWDEPQGVGEISMLNNLTLLHSSYYRDPNVKGYKIGVRYLA